MHSSVLAREIYTKVPCADPERFVRRGPTLNIFLVDEEREDQTKSGPSIGPPSKRHLAPIKYIVYDLQGLEAITVLLTLNSPIVSSAHYVLLYMHFRVDFIVEATL